MSPCCETATVADQASCSLEGKPDVSLIYTIPDDSSVLTYKTTECHCLGCSNVSVSPVAAILYGSKVDSCKGSESLFTLGFKSGVSTGCSQILDDSGT